MDCFFRAENCLSRKTSLTSSLGSSSDRSGIWAMRLWPSIRYGKSQLFSTNNANQREKMDGDARNSRINRIYPGSLTRFAKLASTRLTPDFVNAMVTSSSLPSGLLSMTTPSPNLACLTR